MFLLIDKPKGMTSHDVVDVVRNKTGEKRVGHGGTLDPNATGLLIVGVGREATRKLHEISAGKDKEYEAEIMLGEERDTGDLEGRKLSIFNSQFSINSQISKSNVTKTLNFFIGEQMQVPPEYSAIKIKGKKAYELAREGKKVTLQPRKVVIHSIKLLSYSYPVLRISCRVSSGTYIRSLAVDIGRKLGTGAYLNNLRRTRIGEYKVEDAIQLHDL